MRPYPSGSVGIGGPSFSADEATEGLVGDHLGTDLKRGQLFDILATIPYAFKWQNKVVKAVMIAKLARLARLASPRFVSFYLIWATVQLNSISKMTFTETRQRIAHLPELLKLINCSRE
ncbi:Uncharacterized protein HZ326_11618 [Fusarium oxysporum f. sp. albedinis]|nr:Uncharacterized protein HZ326_11618 [Fusarium oxysporum f. sp. albedinis]